MEVFYILLLTAILVVNFFLFSCMKGIRIQNLTHELLLKQTNEYLNTIIENIDCKDDRINERFDHVLVKIENLVDTKTTPTSPMKQNNWDSIRAAFKVPTRVEVNERT